MGAAGLFSKMTSTSCGPRRQELGPKETKAPRPHGPTAPRPGHQQNQTVGMQTFLSCVSARSPPPSDSKQTQRREGRAAQAEGAQPSPAGEPAVGPLGDPLESAEPSGQGPWLQP